MPPCTTRHEALEPVRQGVAERFGSVEKNAAEGLAIRHDVSVHGGGGVSSVGGVAIGVCG